MITNDISCEGLKMNCKCTIYMVLIAGLAILSISLAGYYVNGQCAHPEDYIWFIDGFGYYHDGCAGGSQRHETEFGTEMIHEFEKYWNKVSSEPSRSNIISFIRNVTMPFWVPMQDVWKRVFSKTFNLCFSKEPALYAALSTKFFWKASPPTHSMEDWINRARNIGIAGWDKKFLFFDNDGMLHAVTEHGEFYKGPPPAHGHDNWIARATRIGDAGWNQFEFLFYHPNGELYAVINDKFYKASPPKHHNDFWMLRAKMIGTKGWSAFKFLFFDHEGTLHGVLKTGQFRRAAPPVKGDDNWIARSALIGTEGWEDFKFLVFDPLGMLYGATAAKGTLLMGTPPKFALDNWSVRAKVVGIAGWNSFHSIFFNSKLE